MSMTNQGDRPVRVVHVVLQMDTGGMEKLLVEFARHADRDRFDLRFVSLTKRGKVADQIEACGWPVTVLEKANGFQPELVLRLAGLFRRWQTQVVHTHNTAPLIYAAPAGRLARVQTVIHTRHGQRFQASSRRNTMFRLSARLTDRVVCVSEDSARLSIREGAPKEKVMTIRNGIDISRFAFSGPKDFGPAVMVGRLSPEKDVETLLHAVAIIIREEPSFQLVIAGGGPCLPALQWLARRLGVHENVRFLGEIQDIPTLLSGASLFVLSSLTEGISLTILEAMARGLPVAVTRVGGNPEVVVDGQTGLLVPSQSPAELAAIVLQLYRDTAEGRRLGWSGRKRVESHFDARRMVADYESLYLEQDAMSSRGYRGGLVGAG